MNKKISFVCIGLIFTNFFALLAWPAQTLAIIADAEARIAEQKAEAEAHVLGTVISTKYFADEDRFTQYVDYKVKIKKVYRGEHVSVGSVFELRHDCNAASEMRFVVPKSDCITYSPKVGEGKEIYMNHTQIICDMALCPQYSQAVIYKDEIINNFVAAKDVGSVLLSSVTIYLGAGALSIIVIIIVIMLIRKKKKPKVVKKLL